MMLRFGVLLEVADFLHKMGEDFQRIPDDSQGRDRENGGLRILVDGDDVLGFIHAGGMLDGTGNPAGDVKGRSDGLAFLSFFQKVMYKE